MPMHLVSPRVMVITAETEVQIPSGGHTYRFTTFINSESYFTENKVQEL